MMMFSVIRIAFMSTPIAHPVARADGIRIGRTARPSHVVLSFSGKYLNVRPETPER